MIKYQISSRNKHQYVWCDFDTYKIEYLDHNDIVRKIVEFEIYNWVTRIVYLTEEELPFKVESWSMYSPRLMETISIPENRVNKYIDIYDCKVDWFDDGVISSTEYLVYNILTSNFIIEQGLHGVQRKESIKTDELAEC